MRVAGSHAGDGMAPVEHGEPVAVRSHVIGLHGGGGAHLHGVEAVRLAIKITAGDAIKMFGSHGAKSAVCVARMIQHNHPYIRRGANGGHELGPIRQLGIRHGTAGDDGERIEMTGFGGDFVAGNGGEKSGGAGGLLHGAVIGMMIVIGGHGELDPFAGNGVHALLLGGIAMPTAGECVNVRVRGDQAGRGDFMAQGQLHP